jgi:hypothetical protein
MDNKTFLVSYYNEGDWYLTRISALGFENAEEICKRHGLTLLGEHKFTLRWPLGWLASWLIG